ncbi:MAG TPA: sugar transferase [Terriglobales bacterium]|nr:sugar transferase [Terriglobales bacterium]
MSSAAAARLALPRQRGWRLAIKIACDRVAAAVSLLVLSPLLLLLAVISRIALGPGIFFRQQRPGKHGEPFFIVKFRTMLNRVAPDGRPLPDAERLTGFGAWLRSTSLDELPELWNVLRGEMSIVGPRPLLMQYLGRYSAEQARRHDVLPGITGWAQINGRNAITWQQKFALDVWYVDHWSLWLDLKILLVTFWHVIKRQDISREGHVTTTEFMGDGAADAPH